MYNIYGTVAIWNVVKKPLEEKMRKFENNEGRNGEKKEEKKYIYLLKQKYTFIRYDLLFIYVHYIIIHILFSSFFKSILSCYNFFAIKEYVTIVLS